MTRILSCVSDGSAWSSTSTQVCRESHACKASFAVAIEIAPTDLKYVLSAASAIGMLAAQIAGQNDCGACHAPELPERAVVQLHRGTDFDLYWVFVDDVPLVGIYLGNTARFPAREAIDGELERREVANGETTLSLTRGGVLLSREPLFEAPPGRAPADDPCRWVNSMHVFTCLARPEPGVERKAATQQALALFDSIAIAPPLRTSWESRR